MVLLACCPAEAKTAVAYDGFPAGQSTPEGAASELARAFIHPDVSVLRTVCLPPYGAGKTRAEYVQFLAGLSVDLAAKRKQQKSDPNDPREISKVFAARHLSKNGPASFGYATFGFQDVMFVDVEVLLHNGAKYLKRTLVVKEKDGNWYVHPKPEISPLLSMGLDQESPSVTLVKTEHATTKSVSQDYTRRCPMKVVERHSISNISIQIQPGEKPTGFSPVVTFEILESGEVVNAHIKRSSGIAAEDAYALEWAKSARYNYRPGCGVIGSEGTVTIDY